MLTLARRAFRRFFPRRMHPLLDAAGIVVARDAELETAYRATISADDAFTTNRYREGIRWRHVIQHYLGDDQRTRVLDVGGGNGAIELAFAASPRFIAASVEQLWTRDAIESHRRARAPLRRSLADAAALPFERARSTSCCCSKRSSIFASRCASAPGSRASRATAACC